MADKMDEFLERLAGVEKQTAWLESRVWSGTGNLHDRVHVLEDKNGDRVHEITKLQGDIAKVERVLGLNGYGEKNIVNDLRSVLDSFENLKENLISTKDFRELMTQVGDMKKNMVSALEFQDVKRDVETLKNRGQSQMSFMNYIQLGSVMAVISFLINFIMNRVVVP